MPGDLFAEEPFITNCTIGKSNWNTTALVDTGATGYAFVSHGAAQRICQAERIAPVELLRPKPLRGFDGKTANPITHAIYPRLRIGNHEQSACPMFIADLGQHDIILGRPWMKQHKVLLDMGKDELTFKCNCRRKQSLVAVTQILQKPKTQESTPPKRHDDWKKVMEKALNSVEDEEPQKPVNRRQQETIQLAPPKLIGNIEIAMIGAAPFRMMARRKGAQCFAISLKDIQDQERKEANSQIDPKELLPVEYHDFLDVFSKEKSDELPPHRSCDHHIVLEGDRKPGHAPLYNMSQEELAAIKKYLEENLSKGFIQASTAPYASLVLFVRKPGGGIRFCVDYRRLNQLTRKDRYPLPLLDETLAQMSKAKRFTKLDIRQAFYRIRMATPEDEDLTTFRTRYGLYKYIVMPFGLTNAPATL
jgi:formylmethanofuran dehydrogenase subunit E